MKQLKRIVAMITVILMTAHFSFAQSNAGFIGVTGGLSMPQGNWASSVYPESITQSAGNSSGWAANGSLFGIEGAYFFSKHFGFGASFNYGRYGIKNLETLSEGYRNSFDVDSVNTTVTGYTLWNVMPGLYFRYDIHHLYFIAHASMGVVHATTPKIAVFVEDGGNPDGTLTQETSTATTMGFAGGAGIGFTLVKNVSINLTANYLYCQPVFLINNTNRTTNTGRLITSYSEPLQAFNLLLGLAYTFGKQ